MLRDITIGQYYPADSILHRLDPRVKFIATLAFIISLFISSTWIGYLVSTVFLAAVIRLSKVPFRFMVKGLKAIVILLLITLFFNMIFTPGTPAGSFLDHHYHAGRGDYCDTHGNPVDLSDHRIFCHDADHHAQSADGRTGIAVEALGENTRSSA